MSNTKQLIQHYYDSFNQQNMTEFLNCLTDDVVHDINQGASQQGKQAFSNFMTHMNECYQEKVKDLMIMVNEEDDRAAAEFIIEGHYLKTDKGLPQATGQSYRLPVGTFFTIENNKISRVTTYYNLKDWLQQVGA